jgi:hypothetical protein
MLRPYYQQTAAPPAFYGGGVRTLAPFAYGNTFAPIASAQHVVPVGYNFPQQAYHVLPQQTIHHIAPTQTVQISNINNVKVWFSDNIAQYETQDITVHEPVVEYVSDYVMVPKTIHAPMVVKEKAIRMVDKQVWDTKIVAIQVRSPCN